MTGVHVAAYFGLKEAVNPTGRPASTLSRPVGLPGRPLYLE
jgi:hypothetical protein